MDTPRHDAHLMTPAMLRDGLAVYDVGRGEPLLLMPYPHGWTRVSIAEDTLLPLLAGLGRRVISFDPPGAYRSTRPARVDMPEMLACAGEALEARGHHGPVDVVGHSMGGLCALAFALERPERVRRLLQELARGIPDARLIIFEHSGHRPFEEEPEHFAAAVATFLHPGI